MFRLLGTSLVVATLLSLSVGHTAQAAKRAALTKIWVTKMCCQECAKKICRKLYTVPGVVKVVTNVKANVAVIVPQQGKQPSPKALWGAVQKAGFVVVKLEGPGGVFTRKNPPRR